MSAHGLSAFRWGTHSGRDWANVQLFVCALMCVDVYYCKGACEFCGRTAAPSSCLPPRGSPSASVLDVCLGACVLENWERVC